MQSVAIPQCQLQNGVGALLEFLATSLNLPATCLQTLQPRRGALLSLQPWGRSIAK